MNTFSLVSEAEDFNALEEAVVELVRRKASRLIEAYLENLDRKLMREREQGLRLKDKRQRGLATRFGPMLIERRMYLDEETGRYRYLLDEALKLAPRERASEGLKAGAVELATRHSFREAARLWGKTISHASVHAWTQEAGERCRRDLGRLRRSVFGLGRQIGRAARRARALFCEADGVIIRLQRETRKLLEAKLAVVHEGWERLHPSSSEYRLKQKLAYASLQGSQAFWETVTVLVGRRWEAVEAVKVVAGDGAEWVKKGLGCFPEAVYQLCRFHLARKIRECLGWSKQALGRAMAARKDPEGLLHAAGMAVLEARAPEEKAQAVALVRYLAANEEGLGDYRDRVSVDDVELRGLGAIEGNVDKLVSTRMRKRGMSWTRRGASNMLALLSFQGSGLPLPGLEEVTEAKPRQQARRPASGGETPGIRSVHMPILDSGRPVAKGLRRLSLPEWSF